MTKRISGFTIVELLIVIVVIAILAAITIVVYNGIQNRAYDTTIRSDLQTVAKKLQAWKITDGDGSFPTGVDASTLKAALSPVDIKLSTSAYQTTTSNLLYIDEGGKDFALLAISKAGHTMYYSTKEGSVKDYTGAHSFPGSSSTSIMGDIGFDATSVPLYICTGGVIKIWAN